MPAVVDLQLVRKAVWCLGGAGRRAVGAGEQGADHFALGGGELVGLGVDADRDPRESSASPESDPHGPAHAGRGCLPKASRIPAGIPPRQPAAGCWNRRLARLTSTTQALSVSM